MDPAVGEYIPTADGDNSKLPAGGVFTNNNLSLYHYANNNPVKYVDPDGREQTFGQKLLCAMIRFENRISDACLQINKNSIYIEVQRSELDNGNNGQFYKSTMYVKSGDAILFSAPCQSTADNPKLNQDDKHKGFTVDAGVYIGTFVNKSGSYMYAIRITGGKIKKIDYVLIHCDTITVETKREERAKEGLSNGPFSQPFSLACQILKKEDFDALIGLLYSFGFKAGEETSKQEYFCEGDKIKIVIIDANTNNEEK